MVPEIDHLRASRVTIELRHVELQSQKHSAERNFGRRVLQDQERPKSIEVEAARRAVRVI